MKAFRLFVVSALLLLFELALIRYLASEIPAVGFFKNLVLIASFLGLGLGLNLRIGPDRAMLLFALTSLLPPALVLVSGAAGWSLAAYPGMTDEAVLVANSSFFLGLVLVCLSFVSALIPMAFLGRLLGVSFDAMENPLRAYGWNILGSLAGTVFFSAICGLSSPPPVWFGSGVVLLAVLAATERPTPGRSRILLPVAVSALIVPLAMAVSEPGEVWTPYYKVRLYPMRYSSGEQTGFGLNVNNTWFQRSFDVRFLGRKEETGEEAHSARNLRFVAPFTLARPRKVLVLGSGLGNDTATALLFGAEAVDAVDIDAGITSLSERFHPNRPYQDPRVRLVIDDARHFLSRTENRYDLILFGVLEARSLFSQFANLRLDNYVYTEEALEVARSHLSPGGVLWLNMWVPKEWVAEKFAGMMGQVFGDRFSVLAGEGSAHLSFVAGDGVPGPRMTQIGQSIPGVRLLGRPVVRPGSVTIPTDDWPYVFYRTRQLPLSYLVLLCCLVALSVASFRLVHREALRVRWEFFFLGAAFLLVETSAVVRMALVAGTTWWVNTSVFAGVLAFVFLANAVAARWRTEASTGLFVALFASLALAYLFPFQSLLRLPNVLAVTIAAGILTLPVLFSGAIFSGLFRSADVPSQALASNLLGAILGGFSEYLSMLAGNRAMSLLALAIYGLAFFRVLRRRRA